MIHESPLARLFRGHEIIAVEGALDFVVGAPAVAGIDLVQAPLRPDDVLRVALDADPELRCGLLHAHGEHFTAGLELNQWAADLGKGKFPDIAAGACEPFGLDPARRLSKPMVVAAQGICFTAGIELMLAADVRVAAEGVRFGQIEVKLVTTMLLQQLRADALPGRTMTVRQMPTLSPLGGLKMRLRERA